MDAKTKGFWEKYEEKHVPIDTDLYDVSGFFYTDSKTKVRFIYKPYGTIHEKSVSEILRNGISINSTNAIDKTKFFWKQYEEKFGSFDDEVYELIDFVYINNRTKIKFIYKPYGTIHEQTVAVVLKNGFSALIRSSVNKEEYFWKQYEEAWGPVDSDLYDIIDFSYKHNGVLRFVYKPYGTTHEQMPCVILRSGLSAIITNSVNKEEFFWKQYEEKWGPVDTELYDLSISVYNDAKSKIMFIYKPFGTEHGQIPNSILLEGFSAYIGNSSNPTEFFWKQYEERHGVIDTELIDVGDYVYKDNREKIRYTYKPYRTEHEQTVSYVLQKGLSPLILNAVNKTDFFWKQYEERHGVIDTDLYDLSVYKYKDVHEKIRYIYKPYGTSHEQEASTVLQRGLSPLILNAVNKTDFFWKQYEERWGPVDTNLYEVSVFVYKDSHEKIKYIYKPYGTAHEQIIISFLNNGINANLTNSIDITEFFWKQYEEKWGPVDANLFDLSFSTYKNAQSKIKFIYKPYGTTHEQVANSIMYHGLSANVKNSINPTEFLWKQYEEKWGSIDTDLYDVSIYVYKGAKSKIRYIYNPYGTVHEQLFSNILERNISPVFSNSVDKKEYLKSRWASKPGLIRYVKEAFSYIEKKIDTDCLSKQTASIMYKEYYSKNPIKSIPSSIEKLEEVYGVGGLMDQHGLKENVIETSVE